MTEESSGNREEISWSGEDGVSSQDGMVAEIKARLLPLREGEFSSSMDKVLVYAQSAARSRDGKARDNFIRFARLNLDAALVQALEIVVFRPRLVSKSDEQKKGNALQKAFDRMEHPEKALLDHFVSSSDPLNKYLAAGPWGHEYLRKRGIESESLHVFDMQICELLGCKDTAAGRIVRAYAGLSHALDRLKSERQ
jgi:hypothetical protein